MNVNNANFYLHDLASRYEAQAHMALHRLRHAQEIMDLVQASNSTPVAQATIRWMPEVRSMHHKLTSATEARAREVIESSIEKLRKLQTIDPTEYESERGKFSRDLRYLGGIAPIAFRNGLRGLSLLQQDYRESQIQGVDTADISGVVIQTPERG